MQKFFHPCHDSNRKIVFLPNFLLESRRNSCTGEDFQECEPILQSDILANGLTRGMNVIGHHHVGIKVIPPAVKVLGELAIDHISFLWR